VVRGDASLGDTDCYQNTEDEMSEISDLITGTLLFSFCISSSGNDKLTLLGHMD